MFGIKNFAIMMAAAAALASGARAQDPTTELVSELMQMTSTCNNHAGGPWRTDDETAANKYICGDKKNAYYWTADMDIDCDGKTTAGKCDKAHDCCFQAQTAFSNSKGEFLTAAVDPYYVIPSNFSLGSHGIKGWQIAAIIDGTSKKMTFAFLGDTGPNNIIGEASYATAVILGINPDARNGGSDGPITYIVFTGAAGLPSKPEDHQEVLKVGMAAAKAFITANGGTVSSLAPEARKPGLLLGRNLIRVDEPGHHALQVTDAAGNTVLWKTGDGPMEHDLSELKRGVYFAKTVNAFGKSTAPRKIVLY